MATEYSGAKRELLEKYLRGEMGVQRKSSAIPSRRPDETIPLTHAQEQIWVHAQLAPHLPLYNEPVTIHYSGSLNTEALERSFNEILRRHEAWRTSFAVVDGYPCQRVHDNLTVSLPIVDLTHLPRAQRESVALQIATADAREPLDLTRVPLFRTKLIRLDDKEYRLYLTLCHIIFDGVALYRVFLTELATLYKAYSVGETSPLPEPALQYPDYACWERRALTEEKLRRGIDYWREQLRPPLPEVYLPSDHRAPRLRTFRGSMRAFKLRPPLMKEVRQFCRREEVSVFHVLFAAFAALLQRYSEEERLPVGMVTAGRNRPETESLLGYFLNTVVVPVDVSGNPTFRTLVQRARNWTIDAVDHDQMPFEQLVRDFKVQRDPSRNPLFQALFSLEPPLPAIDPQWRLTQMDVDTGTTKYDLYLELDDRGGEVLARFHYSTDLFERETISCMAMHWKTLLRDGVAHPEYSLSDLSLLNPRERRTLLANGYAGESKFPKDCIHELFEQQAELTPNAIAVIAERQSITYRELNERANQVAHGLLRRGVPQESLVGLSMERSIDMVAALLGILRAGSAYVPLDPRLPDERLSYLLADSKPAAIITDIRTWRPQFGRDAIVLDAPDGLVTGEGKSAQPRTSVHNLAYVMYTSGSTGSPKGVAVEHRSVVNLLSSMRQEPGINSNDILLAVTTLSFDIAGLEIFLPLITGARLVLATSKDVTDGTRLRQLLQQSKATLMQATPATWSLLIEAGWSGSPSLKILCGGESLSAELAKDLVHCSASVWNVYGPTETTIWSSIYRLSGQEDEIIPIGRPIANTAIYVVDKHGNPTPLNVIGEIYIGGDGLAREYLNRPELTARRFVPNWLTPEKSPRLYRTGDLGRWRGNGQLEYFSRMDTQIKLRGMRIELGEIESVLSSHPHVQQAVVTLRGEAEHQKLSAYVIAKSKSEGLDAGELRSYIRGKLPEYMVPAEYRLMESIPMLPSGKVNRSALVDSATVPIAEQAGIGPRSESEVQLAAVWKELLKVRTVSVDQNFFELGGHSLLVLQMVARVRRVLGVELPARTVFEAPTIARLALEVEKARTLGLNTRSPLLQRYLSPQMSTRQDAGLSQLDRLKGETPQNLLEATLEEKQTSSHDIAPPESGLP